MSQHFLILGSFQALYQHISSCSENNRICGPEYTHQLFGGRFDHLVHWSKLILYLPSFSPHNYHRPTELFSCSKRQTLLEQIAQKRKKSGVRPHKTHPFVLIRRSLRKLRKIGGLTPRIVYFQNVRFHIANTRKEAGFSL